MRKDSLGFLVMVIQFTIKMSKQKLKKENIKKFRKNVYVSFILRNFSFFLFSSSCKGGGVSVCVSFVSFFFLFSFFFFFQILKTLFFQHWVALPFLSTSITRKNSLIFFFYVSSIWQFLFFFFSIIELFFVLFFCLFVFKDESVILFFFLTLIIFI